MFRLEFWKKKTDEYRENWRPIIVVIAELKNNTITHQEDNVQRNENEVSCTKEYFLSQLPASSCVFFLAELKKKFRL